MSSIYDWPEFTRDTALDRDFADWAETVAIELRPVASSLASSLPDDPFLMDQTVTRDIDGWLPRVASLAVIGEFYLSQAKLEKLPAKQRAADGKPLTTEADRGAAQEAALGQYRFVRDLLDSYVVSMRDRVRWAQSVRRVQHEANF